jgi:hypothetical protein
MKSAVLVKDLVDGPTLQAGRDTNDFWAGF